MLRDYHAEVQLCPAEIHWMQNNEAEQPVQGPMQEHECSDSNRLWGQRKVYTEAASLNRHMEHSMKTSQQYTTI